VKYVHLIMDGSSNGDPGRAIWVCIYCERLILRAKLGGRAAEQLQVQGVAAEQHLFKCTVDWRRLLNTDWWPRLPRRN
jgi:hypothetical protein